MQFQVPQFIDVEDKIFGPFTFKQFVYLVGGGGLAFLSYRYIPSPFNFLLALGAIVLGVAFAFVEIHKRPLIHFVEAAFWYFVKSKLYIWKKIEKKQKKQDQSQDAKNDDLVDIPKLSEKKLKDLAWGLDINEHVAHARLQEQLEKSDRILNKEERFKF